MKSSLSSHHQLMIIAILLLIHGGMISLLPMKMNTGNSFEPIISIEQSEHETAPDYDWVAMNNSMPFTSISADNYAETQQETREQEDTDQSEPAQTQESIDEDAFDDAIALAQQVLKKETPDKKEEVKKDKITEVPKKIMSHQKSPLTLAQLAQGFSEQLQQSEMAVRSDRGGVASIDQIKHISYCQKILNCLINSYKIHNSNCSTKMLKHKARIHLAINKNGSIHQLALQESSGDPMVDQFLMHMFNDAASSFPPVPEALHADPYHLPTFNIDNLESFRSHQGWYIDNRT